MSSLKLSDTHVDFEDILSQLQAYAQLNAAWKDNQESSTGRTLLEQMAAVGALALNSVSISMRESFLQTAMRDSSIYACADNLGVRIRRKTPAGVTVHLERDDVSENWLLPRYTQFNVNGKPFFSRDQITFLEGNREPTDLLYSGTIVSYTDTTVKIAISEDLLQENEEYSLKAEYSGISTYYNVVYDFDTSMFVLSENEDKVFKNLEVSLISILKKQIRLYEGTIQVDTFISTGMAFQEFNLTATDFTVSDSDIDVYTIDVASGKKTYWTYQQDGIWTAKPNSKVYYDKTNGEGLAVIMFGNSVVGAIPKMGDEINIRYAVTSGEDGNVSLTNLPVKAMLYSIKGYTTTTISGGSNERPARYYKIVAPQIYRAKKRAITKEDFYTICLDYPGIISASIEVQRDRPLPYDLRDMNMARVCILPLDEDIDKMSHGDWIDFLEYLEPKLHMAYDITRIDPIKLNAYSTVEIFIEKNAVSSEIVAKAKQTITDIFVRKTDSLGKKYALSDIIGQLEDIDGIDYINVKRFKLESDVAQVNSTIVPLSKFHFVSLAENIVIAQYTDRKKIEV